MKLAVILIGLATPALAQDLLFFHAPSGNIHCLIATGDGAEARCDIVQLTTTIPPRPADCDLDYGHAFTIGPTDTKGLRACVGDTVADPEGMTLAYGDRIDLGGFTCRSEATGMTCQNALGHGFTLAKARQSLF